MILIEFKVLCHPRDLTRVGIIPPRLICAVKHSLGGSRHTVGSVGATKYIYYLIP